MKSDTVMTDPDLVRFVAAQASLYDDVVEQLTEGHKLTHWMCFIFPQLPGLGHSAIAQHYAMCDLDPAKRYLADPILGSRLRQDVRFVMGHKDKSALEIFGSPDDFKFRSCLTLFAQAASNDSERTLFEQVMHQFYDGPDPQNLGLPRLTPQS